MGTSGNASDVAEFSVIIKDDCEGVTLSSAIQSDPPDANFNSQNVEFSYNPYTAMPSTCIVTTNCQSVAAVPDLGKPLPCQEIDPDSGKVTWNFNQADYTDQSVPPGTYTFTYGVAAGDQADTFSIDLVVPDPCDPPTSLTKVAFENQSYTLTDTGESYTHPDFSI